MKIESACPTWGPLADQADVQATLAELQQAGVRRRSLGTVDLQPVPGIVRDPLVRWAQAVIWRETMRTVLYSLPGLIAINIALLLLTLPDRTTLAIGMGVAGGVGASPVAAMVGFAMAWVRWGHFANEHPGAPAESGYLVVAARGTAPEPPIGSVASRHPGAVGIPAVATQGIR